MKVRKIAALSTEEVDILSNAGKIIGGIKRAFESEEITELELDTVNLLKALSTVIIEVLTKNTAVITTGEGEPAQKTE